MGNNPHNLLVRLLKAREDRDTAKKEIGEYFRTNCLGCEAAFSLSDEGESLCSTRYDISYSCPKGEGYRKAWESYHKAAARAGADLRNCLRYAKGKDEVTNGR